MDNKEAKVNLENQTATVLAQAVAEELGEIPEVSITIEELKALERADRKKRNRKKVKLVGVVAALLLVCGVAAYAALPDGLVAPVDADKNTEQSVQEENGSVVINENGAEGKGVVTYKESNWDKVADMRNKFPDLIIPTYVPDGYEFVELEVEHYIGVEYKATYKYRRESLELTLEEKTYLENGESASILTGAERKIKTEKGDSYIINETDDKLVVMTIYPDGKTVSISGVMGKADCVRIINEIDMP